MRTPIELGVPPSELSVIHRTVTVAAGRFAPGHLGELTQVMPFTMVDDVLAGGAVQAALAATGDLHIPIAATYPLTAVRDAYQALADRKTHGRIVLHPQDFV
jgi:NADPH:quinone reductase-like Zn-dependent oxidoreductase